MGQNLTGRTIASTYEDLVQISGSSRNFLTDGTGSNITNLAVTASNAVSSSYALTASFAENVTPIDTGSFLTTASISDATVTFTKADASTFAITVNNVQNAFTASIATSSSYAQNATSASYALTSTSASHAVNADSAISASYAISSSHADSANSSISASYALTATSSSHALNADNAISASFALTSTSASHAVNADNAINALTASLADNTYIQVKNMEATQIDKGTPCYISASGTAGNIAGIYVADAGNALRMPAGVIAGEDLAAGAEGIGFLNGFINEVDTTAFASGDEIFVAVGGGYTNVAPTGSANFIQKLGNVEKSAVNGSGVINMSGEARGLPNILQGYLWVGDANGVPQAVTTSSLIVNPFPFTGSAEITGSLGVTGSIGVVSSSFSGTVIDNLTTPTASDAVQHVVAISEADYSALVSPDPNTFYIINDITGSLILGDTVVSGSLTVTGTLLAPGLTVPTASYAISASQAESASFAQTASFALNVIPAFPFTGSAEITGSLDIVGPIISGDGTNTVGTNGNEVSLGGDNNAVSGNKSAAVGGEFHNVSGFRAGNFAGEANTNNGTNTVAIGGYNNTVGGTYGVWAGGTGNNLGGTSYFVGGTADANGSGFIYAIIGGQNHNCQTDHTVIAGGRDSITVSGHREGGIFGGSNHTINGSDTDRSIIAGGFNNLIQSGSRESAIIAGKNNITLHTSSVILGGDGLTTTKNEEVVVPRLTISGSFVDTVVISNYASINFADDAAAASGGIPLGGVYRNGNFLMIRIS